MIVSCTIAGNTTVTAGNGAGLQQAAVGGAIEVYNTLISGNTTDGAADDVAWFKDASYKVANSIIGGTVYNADGMAVAGAAFDPASMLSPLGDNGGATKTCVLLGDANPARQYGMSASELKILGETLDPAFGEAVSAIDQTGRFAHGQDGDRSRREINLFTGGVLSSVRPFFCIFGVVTPLLSVAASGRPPPQGGAVLHRPDFFMIFTVMKLYRTGLLLLAVLCTIPVFAGAAARG